MLNSNDKILDLTQKVLVWTDYITSLRIEGGIVNSNVKFSVLARQFLPKFDNLEIKDSYIATQSLTEWISRFEVNILYVVIYSPSINLIQNKNTIRQPWHECK
jgi:hypothetical protein